MPLGINNLLVKEDLLLRPIVNDRSVPEVGNTLINFRTAEIDPNPASDPSTLASPCSDNL